jgi:hypothetical protein
MLTYAQACLVTGSPLFRHQIAKEEDAEAVRQKSLMLAHRL